MLSDGIFLEGTLSASLSDEGGYAYGQYAGGHLRPPAYNDECGYRRMYLAGGVTLSGFSDRWRWQATASVQGLLDRMRMDQDYTEASVFTMEQRQRMAGSTAEIVIRPAASSGDWDHATGLFFLGKANRMAAPVEFLPDGVRTLILDNANRNIPADVGYLSFDEDRFTIGSDFGIGTWNAALFHESILTRGRDGALRRRVDPHGRRHCSVRVRRGVSPLPGHRTERIPEGGRTLLLPAVRFFSHTFHRNTHPMR